MAEHGSEEIDEYGPAGPEEESVWFRLGYALERAREQAPEVVSRVGYRVGQTRGQLRSPAERRTRLRGTRPPRRPRTESLVEGISPTGKPWDVVLTVAAAALARQLLEALPRRRKPGLFGLLRAGAAGAGAVLLRELVRPLVTDQPRETPLAETARGTALAGAARGLLYGGLVEPLIPGPPFVRGAAYGLVEHLVSPWGGLTEIAGARAPHRSLPFLSELFEDFEPGEDTLVDHLVFGIALAALYGSWANGEQVRGDHD